MENALGALLREMRTRRQMSLNRLGAQAGVAKSTLSRWEAGHSQPCLPELEAALGALDASPRERWRALGLIDAPRALARVRESAASGADLGPLPTGGDLLRAMRHRRGRTLEQVAMALGVSTPTLSRWERAQDWPSNERLQALCYLLGAQEAELTALTAGPVAALAGRETGSPTPSRHEIAERLERLAYGPVSPAQAALMDLSYLALEAQAWRLAQHEESALPLLTNVRAWHANQLWMEQRLAEAGRVAQQALRLAYRRGETHRFVFLAAIRRARALVEGSPRPAPARGRQILEHWLPGAAPWPEYEAWMLSEMALYASREGHSQSAPALAEKACLVAQRAENPMELPNRRLDQAKVLVCCGRPREALALLPLSRRSTLGLDASLVGAEALLALGDASGAQDYLQRVYTVLDAYAQPESHHIRLWRARADALAKRLTC